MYYRTIGSNFTVKSVDEKKELIQTIQNNELIKSRFNVIGLDTEQFTGKIHSVIFKLIDNSNKIFKFSVFGEFPTMKLVHGESNNTYIIEFPHQNQKEFLLKPENSQENENSKQLSEAEFEKNNKITSNESEENNLEKNTLNDEKTPKEQLSNNGKGRRKYNRRN